jgi:hypothetical protein
MKWTNADEVFSVKWTLGAGEVEIGIEEVASTLTEIDVRELIEMLQQSLKEAF